MFQKSLEKWKLLRYYYICDIGANMFNPSCLKNEYSITNKKIRDFLKISCKIFS